MDIEEMRFQMISHAEYDKIIASLSHGSGVSCHLRGNKRYGQLNNVTRFHVNENFSLDTTHTLLEIGYVFFCLISELLLTLSH
jgi:hypothetical protein